MKNAAECVSGLRLPGAMNLGGEAVGRLVQELVALHDPVNSVGRRLLPGHLDVLAVQRCASDILRRCAWNCVKYYKFHRNRVEAYRAAVDGYRYRRTARCTERAETEELEVGGTDMGRSRHGPRWFERRRDGMPNVRSPAHGEDPEVDATRSALLIPTFCPGYLVHKFFSLGLERGDSVREIKKREKDELK